MNQLAADLCQEFFKVLRAPQGAGEAGLLRTEALLRRLSSTGYEPMLLDQANEILGLLHDWVTPAGWEAHAKSVEAFQELILARLNQLLSSGLLNDQSSSSESRPG